MPDRQYHLKLFITGESANSKRAVNNIEAICEALLAGRYTLEIIDILQAPQAAETEKIIATPTLLKIAPLPGCRIVGDLSDKKAVIHLLDLDS